MIWDLFTPGKLERIQQENYIDRYTKVIVFEILKIMTEIIDLGCYLLI